MDRINQEENSGTSSDLIVKRKRGRPRKDPSLSEPPGFVRMKEYPPQGADRRNGIDIMIGQQVTGVVVATFDSGYLLSVRIGNTDKYLKGVVFKPGHCIPVTAANDVAPEVEMIRRNDSQLSRENKVWSRGKTGDILEGSIVTSKLDHSTSKVSPYTPPPVGVRGNVVPVVLQPVSISNGSEAGSLDVLPQSVPTSQIFVPSQPHSSHQIRLGTEQDNTGSFEIGKSLKSTDSDTSSSSQREDGNGTVKYISEISSFVSTPELGSSPESVSVESLQSQLASKYGTGKMTELLMAVQENVKDIDARKSGAVDSNCHDEASIP